MIKIDRSFVSQVTTSAHHRVLVAASASVARSLGMGTVAEGMETVERAEAPPERQCDDEQGYFCTCPLEAEAATCWMAARAEAPAMQNGR